MTKEIQVSVILTSYNQAEYLHEAIDSVLNQTFADFELIIWDDASTDKSWAIIQSYTDLRIRAFRSEINQYGVPNVNRAISEEAKGEYIAIHHSDDIWEPDKLEKQVIFLNENPNIGAVFSQALIIGENSEPFVDTSHLYYNIFDQPNRNRYEWLNFFFYHWNVLCHPSVLIRRQCYDDCGLYKYGLAQIPDFDMWVRLCLKYDIHILPEKLVRFRVRDDEMNASGNRPETRIRLQFEFLQILDNYRGIKTSEEFVKVFPNAQKYFRAEGFDKDFALGMVTLEPDTNNVEKLFGLQLLCDALNDPDRAMKINDLYGFSSKDFIVLTAKYDIFSVELITGLIAQVVEKEQSVQALAGQLSEITVSRAWRVAMFLRRVREWLAPHGSWRGRLSKRLLSALLFSLAIRRNPRIQKDSSLIRSSGLFDEGWYLANHPDVANAKIDPAHHNLLFGGLEGRSPNPLFNSSYYLDAYPDVRKAGVNPLLHYPKKGRNEERLGYTTLDVGKERPVKVNYPLASGLIPSRLRSPLGDIRTVSFYSHSSVDALAYLRLLGPARRAGLKVIDGVENGQIHVERATHGDVVVLQRDFPADLAAYEEILALAHREGKPVILDLDDLLLELPEDHPDRQTHRYARALLPILQALTEVDLVTVATPNLREYVLSYNKNVVVLPNYLDDNLWRLRTPASSAGQKDIFVIGYMGGITHMPDLDMIVPVLLDLDRRHPGKLLFRFWGIQPPMALRWAPNVQWSSANFPTYPGFAKYFQGQTADIFIGPLRDNLFNVCKSPIKYFEYSALGAPGIFSRITPYSSVIVDGFNGLLASSLSDWTEALNRLIEDPELRLMIARNAQENIRSNWLLSNNAARWPEAYTMAVKVAAGEKAPESDFPRLVRSLAHQVAEISGNKMQAPGKEQGLTEIKRSAVSDSDLSLINDSKLFDASWYLANNRDVAESDMSPALHHLQFGGFEGRDPSPKFNSSWYLAAYKDVEQARINPLLHYIKHGRNEGRSALPQQEDGGASRNTDSKNTPGHRSITRYLSGSYLVWKAEGFKGIRRRFSWGLDKIYSTWKQGGPMLVWEKVRFRLGHPVPDSFSFHPFLTFPADAISSEDVQRQDIENFHFRPLISILIPVYNTPPRYLAAAIELDLQANLYKL